MTRQVDYDAIVSYSGNQAIRVMSFKLNSKPREKITIGNQTFSLDSAVNQNFSLSTINDVRPACDYYAGNWSSKKTYSEKSGKTVSVLMTSQIYGYSQYWGATENQEIKISVEGTTNKPGVYDSWGGNGTLKISTVTANNLTYIENKPDAISFEGGYLRRQENKSVLQYDLQFPLFDSKGISTDNIVSYRDTLDITGFPVQERLPVFDTSAIMGHWYEENVRQLMSLGIISDGYVWHYTQFDNPITRKEFAKAISESVKIEPLDIPVEDTKKTKSKFQTPVDILPFYDVDVRDEYYKYIYTLYKNGVMSGTASSTFSPDEPLSRAQALVIIVRMLGLESMAQDSMPITSFNDNDDIPSWARSSVLVAEKIGLVRGNENNELKPNEVLTKAEAATLINNLLIYMRNDMVKDYTEKIILRK